MQIFSELQQPKKVIEFLQQYIADNGIARQIRTHPSRYSFHKPEIETFLQ